MKKYVFKDLQHCAFIALCIYNNLELHNMGKIITVAHQKGGVGKSTLAMNLAVCFQDQLNVALVDTDLQGSLFQIKEELPGLAVVGNDQLQEIKRLDYDLVIVDTPPYLSNKLPELFSLSDFILIPTKAGFFDVMAIRSTIALLKDAQVKKPDIQAGIVMNMIKPRSGITKEVSSLLQSMETPVLATMIHDRVSIARSSITAGVLQGSDNKAIEEITSLAEEIVNRISA
jgi:chromosome partitioning protein